MEKEHLAYVAGFIDGEGCFTIRHYKRQYQGYLIVANNSLPALEFVQSVLGGKLYIIKKGNDWRQLHITGGALPLALRALLPYLINKREEALVLLAFLERPVNKGRRITDEMLAEMDGYCDQLKALKQQARNQGPDRK